MEEETILNQNQVENETQQISEDSLENAAKETKAENLEESSTQTEELNDDQIAYKEFVDSLPTHWYVLHTFSGYENVAKENLETMVEKFNLQDRIFDIIIPIEDVVEEKNGKKKLVQRKSMPCYIFIKMKYADDIWHNVIRTRGVTGFAGPKGRPLPLPEHDIVKFKLEKIKVDVDLSVNDKVEIIDGPLNGQVGTVLSVNTETGVVSVEVEMFGRETAVDVEISQVRKINA